MKSVRKTSLSARKFDNLGSPDSERDLLRRRRDASASGPSSSSGLTLKKRKSSFGGQHSTIVSMLASGPGCPRFDSQNFEVAKANQRR